MIAALWHLQRNEGRYKRNKQGLRPKGNPSVWMVRLISLVAVIILAFTVIFSLALLLFGETAEKELFYHFRFRISTGGLYDRQVSLTCNLDVLCVHPALHADTQPAAFFKRGSARFRIFGSKLDIGHHTLFIIYKQLCGLFQNVRKHRRIIALLVCCIG